MDSTLFKRLRPRTYSVTIYLVVGVLLVQGIALLSIFYYRYNIGQMVFKQKKDRAASASKGESNPTASATSAAASEKTAAFWLGRFEEARRAGDTAGADHALQNALSLEPANSLALFQKAQWEQGLGRSREAQAAWQRLVELGPGPFYEQAKEQLLVLSTPGTPSKTTPTPSTLEPPRTVEAAAPALRIGAIEKFVITDTAQTLQMKLRVPLEKSASTAVLDSSKVSVSFYFYDRVGDGALANNPSVTARFENFSAWQNAKAEFLVADYTLDRAKQPGARYFGYWLRVYYQNQLQEERMEPANLSSLLPASINK